MHRDLWHATVDTERKFWVLWKLWDILYQLNNCNAIKKVLSPGSYMYTLLYLKARFIQVYLLCYCYLGSC
jgi:hypothetical protein